MQQLLPPAYEEGSQHVQWAAAFASALSAADALLGPTAPPAPADVAGAFRAAWEQAPAQPAPAEVACGHAALHIAATAASFSGHSLQGQHASIAWGSYFRGAFFACLHAECPLYIFLPDSYGLVACSCLRRQC